MLISCPECVYETGITQFEVRVNSYDIKTTLAINWFQTADGNWRFIDRGELADIYETKIRIVGLQGSIDLFLQQYRANRNALTNQFTLKNFHSNEKIFGSNVDYSGTIVATVMGDLYADQRGLKSWELKMTLQAIGLTFTGSPSFPALKYLDIGYSGNIDKYAINKMDSYSGAFTYIDHQPSYTTKRSEPGLFEGTFQFTDDEIIGLREYMRQNRGTTTTITSISGLTRMFGINRPVFPNDIKILDMTEKPRGIMATNWYANLKMAEVL